MPQKTKQLTPNYEAVVVWFQNLANFYVPQAQKFHPTHIHINTILIENIK